ncbi:hypothetical protein HOLleu_31843 [Holothuria leucospilota]|uniref:Alpha/beta hydrolase fold-5 domain-containing protein n=1 Tax=Holothuria leucospilota TaxID=206669 RepID=A0A9Q1BHZ0_HOLLE|nr:hypothetical protein HOLleu_31843 [Holothuria leucospilota]
MIFKIHLCIFVLLLNGFLQVTKGAPSNVYLDPVKQGRDVILIVIPGAYIRGEAYRPLCEELQRQSSLRLHVALTTDYVANLPNPGEAVIAINNALAEFQRRGLDESTPLFLSGHSLGGAVIEQYIFENADKISGVLLWASYFSETKLEDIPVPLMHLSGSIDGQVTVTDMTREFEQLMELHTRDQEMVYRLPVVISENVNHAQFASGPMPLRVRREDIPAEIPSEEAYEKLAKVCSDFILVHTPNLNDAESKEQAKFDVKTAVAETNSFLQPIFEARGMEEKRKIRSYKYSEWLNTAQNLVANISDESQDRILTQSLMYDYEEDLSESVPSIVTDSSQRVVITARGILRPATGDKRSSREIAAKLKTQEVISTYLSAEFGSTVDCRAINENCLVIAMDLASKETVDRYKDRGRQMSFADDMEVLSIPEWDQTTLSYSETASTMTVRSSIYRSPMEPYISGESGVQYCNLLSPYRAIEWLYVLSLKPYNG